MYEDKKIKTEIEYEEGFMKVPILAGHESDLFPGKEDRVIPIIKLGCFKMMSGVMPSDSDVWTESKWYVLKVDDGKALLLSVECWAWEFWSGENLLLEAALPCTWEKSYLRHWLNGELFETGFSEDEKAVILPMNQYRDKMFIMTAEEVEKYVPENIREAETPFADRLNDGRIMICKEPSMWWTNTVGEEENMMAIVSWHGNINAEGLSTDSDEVGVRPAIWVDMEALAKHKGLRVELLL